MATNKLNACFEDFNFNIDYFLFICYNNTMSKIDKILCCLDEFYPNPQCALNFSSPYELLVAVILSAQCTDKRVNVVTEQLFKLANTPEQMLSLGEEKLKQIIHSCGFYNNKSKSIISASNDLITRFGGVVPSSLEELTSLAGVGRKTANVVISVAFGGQTIAVDTHVHRVSKRLGLANATSTPYECEKSLLKVVPKNRRSKFHHQVIWFGREHCKAINPNCLNCKLKGICNHKTKTN